jgi:hypothetical protein
MQSISCASLRFPELYFLPEAAARALVSAAKNPIPQEDVTRNSGLPFKLENDKQFARQRVERNNLTKVATIHTAHVRGRLQVYESVYDSPWDFMHNLQASHIEIKYYILHPLNWSLYIIQKKTKQKIHLRATISSKSYAESYADSYAKSYV